ncbi:MAG: M24 family metallopeptidase, partial [Nitrospinota bacterium]
MAEPEVRFPRFSDAEMARRHGLVRQLMEERALEALLVHGGSGAGAGVHWLTHYPSPRPCWLILPREGAMTLFLHFFNHIPCTRAITQLGDIRCYHPSAPLAVAGALREKGLEAGRVGVVGLATTIPHAQFERLKAELPRAHFEDVSGPFHALRKARSEEELAWFRESARLTDATCEALEAHIRPGLSEFDLSRIIHDAFLPEGGQLGIHFLSTTPMANPARPVPWQYPTPRRLRAGDAVIAEITVSYWGYAAQIHRPFAVARAPTPLYQALFDAALECYERVRAIAKPGTTSREIVDATALIEERGFTVFDSLFHGEAGRNPELGTRTSAHAFEEYVLQENEVVVVQPNPMTPDGRAGLQ